MSAKDSLSWAIDVIKKRYGPDVYNGSNVTFADLIETRHPGTQHLFSLFNYGYLPEGKLRDVSTEACGLAIEMIWNLQDGPELTAGLRKLLEAKDCFVRQAVVDGRS